LAHSEFVYIGSIDFCHHYANVMFLDFLKDGFMSG